MGYHLLPVLLTGRFDRGPHQLEVRRALVRADIEMVAEVVEAVLVPPLSREEEGELAVWLRGIDVAVFVGERV